MFFVPLILMNIANTKYYSVGEKKENFNKVSI